MEDSKEESIDNENATEENIPTEEAMTPFAELGNLAEAYLANNANNVTELFIMHSATDKVLSKDIVKLIRESGKATVINFIENDEVIYSYTLTPDIPEIDLDLNVGLDNTTTTYLDDLNSYKEQPSMVMARSDSIPGAILKIKVDSNNDEYYIGDETTAVFTTSDADGFVSIPSNVTSTYISKNMMASETIEVVEDSKEEDESSIQAESSVELPKQKTLSGGKAFLYMAIALVAAVAALCVGLFLRSNDKKNNEK